MTGEYSKKKSFGIFADYSVQILGVPSLWGGILFFVEVNQKIAYLLKTRVKNGI
jgi:hypothetical protein